MDIQKSSVLHIYPLRRKEDDPDPSRAYVFMPVGTKPFAISALDGGQIGLAAIVPSEFAALVEHSVVVMQADLPVLPLLGRRLGDPIGIITMMGRPLTIVPELPWPEAPANG